MRFSVHQSSVCPSVNIYHLFQSLWANFNQTYLHFIRNARLKSIRSSDWYLPITARPNHFWRRNIRTTFFHRNIAQLYQFTQIMGVPKRWELNKFEKMGNLFRADRTQVKNKLLLFSSSKLQLFTLSSAVQSRPLCKLIIWNGLFFFWKMYR